MGAAPISTASLLTALGAVILLEAAGGAAGQYTALPRLWLLAFVRLAQTAAVVALVLGRAGALAPIGLDRRSLLPGCHKGLVWSAAFAAAAGVVLLLLLGMDRRPLAMIRSPLPSDALQQALFFFVGGIVAPVAEEVVFRGLIFGYLRRWGLAAAVLISTALFAALHLPAIPVTQVVGGLVFAIAYHRSGSLMTPITIHVLGNLAIFTLSLPVFA